MHRLSTIEIFKKNIYLRKLTKGVDKMAQSFGDPADEDDFEEEVDDLELDEF
ncbi:MAG: hypothetical protein AABX91_01150 [Nanoarchaeota archaeon]